MSQPPYGYGPPPDYRPPPPNHQQSTTVLVLGILSLVVCGLIGPFAWSMGTRVVREIDASGGYLGGRTEANVGRILGIVATVLLVGGLLFVVVVFVFGAVLTTQFGSTTSTP